MPQPMLLRGSLITFRRKCGNPRCRCAEGEPHESPALSCKIGKKTHLITLGEEEVPAVRAALERYAKRYEQLEQRVEEGVAELRQRIAERRELRKRSNQP